MAIYSGASTLKLRLYAYMSYMPFWTTLEAKYKCTKLQNICEAITALSLYLHVIGR